MQYDTSEQARPPVDPRNRAYMACLDLRAYDQLLQIYDIRGRPTMPNVGKR